VTVTLVCGPPCGGKSTYVRQNAKPGDLIICHDLLAQAAGSKRHHNHELHYGQAAKLAYGQAVDSIPQHDGDVWVIRCAPEATRRGTLAEGIGADRVVVLMPSRGVALARVRHTRRDVSETKRVVVRWYARYQPREGDEVITGAASSGTDEDEV
jgi:predicted kinase